MMGMTGRVPSANTWIHPPPNHTHQGRRWNENDWEDGGGYSGTGAGGEEYNNNSNSNSNGSGGGFKDIWMAQDDREGENWYSWGLPPGGEGFGGEESAGLVRFDSGGDVWMVDILDLEARRRGGGGR